MMTDRRTFSRHYLSAGLALAAALLLAPVAAQQQSGSTGRTGASQQQSAQSGSQQQSQGTIGQSRSDALQRTDSLDRSANGAANMTDRSREADGNRFVSGDTNRSVNRGSSGGGGSSSTTNRNNRFNSDDDSSRFRPRDETIRTDSRMAFDENSNAGSSNFVTRPLESMTSQDFYDDSVNTTYRNATEIVSDADKPLDRSGGASAYEAAKYYYSDPNHKLYYSGAADIGIYSDFEIQEDDDIAFDNDDIGYDFFDGDFEFENVRISRDTARGEKKDRAGETFFGKFNDDIGFYGTPHPTKPRVWSTLDDNSIETAWYESRKDVVD